MLQTIYRDGEETLKQLEADIEDEHKRANDEEVEFKRSLQLFKT